jgi:hypothetical protein
MSISEVAHFRNEQALQEHSARQGLCGLAAVASHEVIEKRVEQGAARLSAHIAQLIAEGKQDEARALVMNDQLWEALWTQEGPEQKKHDHI